MRFPLEILLEILANAGPAELATLCRVNSTVCHHAQNALYRDIVDPTNTDSYATLIRAPHLARRVKSFYLAPSRQFSSFSMLPHRKKSATMNLVLQGLTSLHTLILDAPCVSPTVLNGCTFRLRAFSCHLPVDDILVDILSGQPLIEELTLLAILVCYYIHFAPEILPNLTKITAHARVVEDLICGRPVCDVTIIPFTGLPTDPNFLLTSTAPVHTFNANMSVLTFVQLTDAMSSLISLSRLTVNTEPVELPVDDDVGPGCQNTI
jgi:hypothetical protein